MNKLKLSIAALALGSALGTAEAAIVVNLAESSTGITLSYGPGTLNTAGLAITNVFTSCNLLFTGSFGLIGGTASDGCTAFGGNIAVTQSAGWTLNGGNYPWSTIAGVGGLFGSADFFGAPTIIIGDDPSPAIVGVNAISGITGTVNGLSFAAAGLTNNQFIQFTWGTDSLRFVTSAASSVLLGNTVPEPKSLALVGLALAGLGLSKRKRA